MSYVLEHEGEANRLEKQAQMVNYSLNKELKALEIPKGALVIDAGCGSGLVSRYISNNFNNVQIHAYDFSEIRLQQAKKLTMSYGLENITYMRSNLEKMDHIKDGTYDFLVNRFVLEHLDFPQRAVDEFYRILKPGGSACVVDLDGIFMNIYTANLKFNSLHKKVIECWPTDLFVGRKIPCMLERAGFKNITFENQTMNFKGKDLDDELELTRERLEYITPTLKNILGSETDLNFYKSAYQEEFRKESTVLFYNKFIVYAQKAG